METLVRVSRHRKCSGSIDLIRAEGDWIERTTKRKPPYGISCYMLSFGDLDNPELDCEVYLTIFEVQNLQKYLNAIDLSKVPDCVIKPGRLDIIIKATADNLETCSMCGDNLSAEMHCFVWKHKDHPTDIKQETDNYWILEFTDFHLGFGSEASQYHATQIQIECASFQLAELRGAINGLLSSMKKQKEEEEEEKQVDRNTRDNKIKADMEKPKRRPTKALIHRGAC